MFGRSAAIIVGLLIGGLTAGNATAQDRSAAKAYAEGVHAYFAGDYARAIEWLSRAIEEDDTDPRAYYFRGAAKHARGDTDGAKQDFAQGAHIEVFGPPLPFAINKELERVQGAARIAIEQARRAAEEEKVAADLARKNQLYETLRRAEQFVLYPPKPLPAAVQLVSQVKPAGLTYDPFKSGDLFAAGTPAPDEVQNQLLAKPIRQPSTATPAAGAAPAATPAPAAGDPFGAPSKPSSKPPQKNSGDPFGDPFGN